MKFESLSDVITFVRSVPDTEDYTSRIASDFGVNLVCGKKESMFIWRYMCQGKYLGYVNAGLVEYARSNASALMERACVHEDNQQVVNAITGEVVTKRGRGRPRKVNSVAQVVEGPKRGRGRPRKVTNVTQVVEGPKRGRGRPRKVYDVVYPDGKMVKVGSKWVGWFGGKPVSKAKKMSKVISTLSKYGVEGFK